MIPESLVEIATKRFEKSSITSSFRWTSESSKHFLAMLLMNPESLVQIATKRFEKSSIKFIDFAGLLTVLSSS